MGNARGFRRDFVALEKRRLEAVKLFAKSLNNSEIGRRLKVSNQTVQQVAEGTSGRRQGCFAGDWASGKAALLG
jgi:predicted DNA-binding protein (UPF0251 family)